MPYLKIQYLIFHFANGVYDGHIVEPPSFPDETPVFHTSDRQRDSPQESNIDSDRSKERTVIRQIPNRCSDGVRRYKCIRVYVHGRVQSRSDRHPERCRARLL